MFLPTTFLQVTAYHVNVNKMARTSQAKKARTPGIPREARDIRRAPRGFGGVRRPSLLSLSTLGLSARHANVKLWVGWGSGVRCGVVCVVRRLRYIPSRARGGRLRRAFVVWVGDRETRAEATTAPCRARGIARERKTRVRAGDAVAARRVGVGVARVLGVKKNSLLVVGWRRETPGEERGNDDEQTFRGFFECNSLSVNLPPRLQLRSKPASRPERRHCVRRAGRPGRAVHSL